MRWAVILLVGVLGFAACDGDGGSSPTTEPAPDTTAPVPATVVEVADVGPPVPTCGELIRRALTAEILASGCLADGTVVAFHLWPCEDGRRLAWNEHGWAFLDGPLHPFPSGADTSSPPDNAARGCKLAFAHGFADA